MREVAPHSGHTPVVSVGLPVRNGERYLRDAIDSILNQTYADFELVVSDNASTDSTEEICRSYAEKDDRIRYTRQETNRGASFNFNFVAKEARGKYFKWHAHDDACRPAYLSSCVAALESAPASVVLCQCRSVLINEQGEPYANYEQERNNIEHDRPHQRLAQLVNELRLCTYVFGLIRTETLLQTRMIDRFVSADVVLLVELALRGKFLMLQEFTQLRRVHHESSRLSNADAKSVAQWFDPSARGLALNPRIKYGIECLKSILRAPLSSGDRARCLATFTAGALRRRSAAEARERSRAEREAVEMGERIRRENGGSRPAEPRSKGTPSAQGERAGGSSVGASAQ